MSELTVGKSKSLAKGKLPPQAIDLETMVLGAIMVDTGAIDEVIDKLKPDVFYMEKHRLIFEAILEIFQEDGKVDIQTVSRKLKDQKKLDKVGGDYYLIQISQGIATSAHINYHTHILLQMHIKREIIRNSSAIIEKSYDEGEDSLKLLDSAYDDLNQVSEILVSNTEVDLRDITIEIIDEGGKLYRNEIKPGIETPITKLTQKMGGWRNGELIILAARPGMGKTAFALLSGWVASLAGIPVAFFSLEMSAKKLVSRLWMMDCRIEGDKFTKDGLSPQEQGLIHSRASEMENIPFYIDDSSSLTIHTLRIKAKRMAKNHGIKIIIVDYLQLMDGSSKNREQEISQISRGLKKLALELDVPVIALSQLSRKVEERGGNKRPMLSDLRESGAIEQDADVVQFIYRPEYYNIDEWDDYDRSPCHGQAEFIIAKNRNGGLVRSRMRFEPQFTLFSDLEPKPFSPIIQPVAVDADEPENEDLPF